MTWAKGDLRYCGGCRARHRERDRGRGVDFPRCETIGDCEVLMGAHPYQLYPDNWIPIVIYERAIGLSPMEIVTIPRKDGGTISLSRRNLSMEALRFALEDYADVLKKYSRDWILDSISIIQSVFDEALISKAK